AAPTLLTAALLALVAAGTSGASSTRIADTHSLSGPVSANLGDTVIVTASLGCGTLGTTIKFTVSGAASPASGTGTTDASGTATFTFTDNNPTTETVTINADDGAGTNATPIQITFNAASQPTTLTLSGPGSANIGDPVTVSANLS